MYTHHRQIHIQGEKKRAIKRNRDVPFWIFRSDSRLCTCSQTTMHRKCRLKAVAVNTCTYENSASAKTRNREGYR